MDRSNGLKEMMEKAFIISFMEGMRAEMQKAISSSQAQNKIESLEKQVKSLMAEVADLRERLIDLEHAAGIEPGTMFEAAPREEGETWL